MKQKRLLVNVGTVVAFCLGTGWLVSAAEATVLENIQTNRQDRQDTRQERRQSIASAQKLKHDQDANGSDTSSQASGGQPQQGSGVGRQLDKKNGGGGVFTLNM